MKTIGKHPLASISVVIVLTIAAEGFWPSLAVFVVGSVVALWGIGTYENSKKDSAPMEGAVPHSPVHAGPGPTGYVRVHYRHPSDRRPAATGASTYTFSWPHREPPIPGTWVELPSDFGTESGVVVEDGRRSDYAGQIKPVGRIMTELPRVASEATSHNAPVATRPKAVEPWGACDMRTEVEFEHLHRTQIAFVLRDHGEKPGTQFRLDATVVQGIGPCPAVVINGQWVGNVIEGVSPLLREALRKLGERGQGLAVPARLWSTDDDGTLRSRITVWLPEASEIDPPGPLPTGPHLVLPAGPKIQVTGEEHYLDELVALLDGEQEVPVVAELYRLERVSARSIRTVVGVRIYGDEVGSLTPATSAHFLPLLEACDEEGVAVCCRASVKGNQLKADVVLNARKAGELSNEWIQENLYAPLADEFRPFLAPSATGEDMRGGKGDGETREVGS